MQSFRNHAEKENSSTNAKMAEKYRVGIMSFCYDYFYVCLHKPHYQVYFIFNSGFWFYLKARHEQNMIFRKIKNLERMLLYPYFIVSGAIITAEYFNNITTELKS